MSNGNIDGVSFTFASVDKTSENSSLLLDKDINWDLCFICETVHPQSVKVTKPYTRTTFNPGDPSTYGTYRTISLNLRNALEINALPNFLRRKIENVTIKSDLSFEEALQAEFCKKQSNIPQKVPLKV